MRPRLTPRRLSVLCAALLTAFATLTGPAAAATLQERLAGAMRSAGGQSGAYVVNLGSGEPVFRWRHTRRRILASNTKLFTTAAALAWFGPEGKLVTEVRATGELSVTGVLEGNLYLRGGGDPTFGSRRFTRRSYRRGATVETLARQLEELGITRVNGRVYGDESRFDARRGGPASGYGVSSYVGPLSALSFDRGLASLRGFSYQRSPAAFAAAKLDQALERRGVSVAKRPRARRTPADARLMVAVESPPMERLISIANKPSDNFFAEMLLKGVALVATRKGTTRRGARLVARFAAELGARARIVDGSGLSRRNQASPYRVTRLLIAMLGRQELFQDYFDSLAVAGRDGTLRDRMRRGPARRRCRAKTGTLSNVSTLSGYCRARSGELYAFSILMNGVGPAGARRIQDRMAQAIAGIR